MRPSHHVTVHVLAFLIGGAVAFWVAGCDDAENSADGATPDLFADLGAAEAGPDSSPPQDGASAEGMTTDTTSPDLGSDTVAPVDSSPTEGTGDSCVLPSYPSDCSLVSMFQCGFSASCSGSVVTADWHEHVFCGSSQPIIMFKCTYTCPGTCIEAATWPTNGTDLVKAYCQQ